MKIGIDKIGFAMPNYYLDIKDLAKARGVDPDKFTKGLMQLEMSITPVTQDIVTLGAAAAHEILTEENKKNIDMIIIGTESGIDQSKAASVFIHSLLGIQPFVRSVEIKEACYGATAALDFAKNHILNNPTSEVLVISSDIAKYGAKTSGESTQGAGSCAMLIKKDPSLLEFNNDNICLTRDVMDFWRPNYSTYAFVEGKFSTEQYLDCLTTTWNEYKRKYNNSIDNFKAICLHLPYPKLGLKGLNTIIAEEPEHIQNQLLEKFNDSIIYSQRVGNIYTGSLFLGLLSLLENNKDLHEGDKIAFYSYGSGAVAEIFSMTLAQNFKNSLNFNRLDKFNDRTRITVDEYEKIFFEDATPDSEGNILFNKKEDNSLFYLDSITKHKRIYKQRT